MSTSVFESLKTAFADPGDAFQWKVLHHFCRLLAKTHTPVSLDALAVALHSSRERVTTGLERNPEAENDQSGNLHRTGSPTVQAAFLREKAVQPSTKIRALQKKKGTQEL